MVMSMLFLPVAMQAQGLVITEIMYNDPSGGNFGDSLEYVEVFNNTGLPLDVTNYQFTAGITFTFPSLTLPPNEYLVIARNATASSAFFNLTNVLQWDAGQSLANQQGEAVVIRDAVGIIQDSVRYYTTAPWPTNANGLGASLQRCDPMAMPNDPASWVAADITNAYPQGVLNNVIVFGSPGLGCKNLPPYVPTFAALPFFESFDGLWMVGDNYRDVPSDHWKNNPATGNPSWRRNDDGQTAAWTNSTTGAYTPTGASGTAYSARFHTGTNNMTAGNLFLYLDFSTPGSKKLSFWYINTAGTDSLSLWMSSDSGLTYVPLANYLTTNGWENKQLGLGNDTSHYIIIRFKATPNTSTSDIGIDQVSVMITPDHDAALYSIVEPLNLVFTPTNPIRVQISNYGNLPLTSCNIHHSIDGVPGTVFPWTGNLASGAVSLNITLAPVTLTPLTTTNIKVWVSDPNGNVDGDPTNDTLFRQTYYQTQAGLPFYEGFDSTWTDKFDVHDAPTAYWNNIPSTGNASWRRNDDGASGGWTALTTGGFTPGGAQGTSNSARFHTSGNAVGGTIGMLELYLDFSTLAGNKEMRFYHVNTAGNDSVAVWISYDGGATYQFLQKYTTAAAWTLRTIPLGSSVSNNVILRIKATSNQGGNTDPHIDELVIDAPQPDVTLEAVTAPVSGCGLTATEQVKIRIRNSGSLPVNNIPAFYYIGTTVVQESIPNTLQPGDTMTYTFTATANLQNPGPYQIAAAVHYPGDYNPAFDSLTITVINIAPINAFPFTENFNSGITNYFQLISRSNSHAAIKPNIGVQNTSALNLDGNVAGSWSQGSGNSTTAAQAWGTYTDHQAFAMTCQVDGSTLVNPELKLDLRQTYINNGGPKYSWFRVLVNDTIEIANQNGVFHFNPATQNSDPFASHSFSLAPFAGTSFKVTLQSSCKYNDANAGGGGIGDNVYIDNVVIREKPAVEMALTSWLNPVSGCDLDQESIIIRMKNQGSAPIHAIPVKYSINDGTTWISEVIADTLLPDSLLTYTFTALADLSTIGTYTCIAVVDAVNDADHSNDTVKATVVHIPFVTVSPLYVIDFESGTGGWSSGMLAGKDEWQFGTPGQTNISAAHSGSNAWMTGLTANYSINTSSYLLSPCLDFTGMLNPFISVWLRLRTENNYDGMIMELSINDSTWFKPLADLGFYNNNSTQPPLAPPKWSGNNNGWVKYTTSLPDASDKGKVQIRFRFESDYTQVDEGVAVDDIQIFEPYPDAAVTQIISPVTGCNLSSMEDVTISVKNDGLLAISGIPVSYTLDLNPAVLDTIADTLTPGQSITFSFPVQADLSTPGAHQISVTADLAGDLNTANNTVVKDVYAMVPATFPVFVDFESTGFETYLGASSGVNNMFSVEAGQGASGSAAGVFTGGGAGSWPANSGTSTTAAQAWSYADHFGTLATCSVTIPQGQAVGLWVDLRQTYSEGEKYSWFRVMVNDTAQVPDIFGTLDFNPVTPNADPFITYLFILSDFAPDLSVSLQSSCKFNLANSITGTADAVILDNVRIDIVEGLPEIGNVSARIYPNPATTELNLVLPLVSEQHTMQLINVQGQVVTARTLESGQLHRVRIADLPSGLYSVLIRGPQLNQSLRFIKTR